MSKRLVAALLVCCAVLGGFLPDLNAQSGDGVKDRLADLENKVEVLLRENSDLRTKVSAMEADRSQSDSDAMIAGELERYVNALAYNQDFSVVRPPSGVQEIYFRGEWRTRVDYRSNTGDLTDEIDDQGLRLDYKFNLGFGFILTPNATEEGSALFIETYFEVQAAGRASNNTAEDLASSIGAGAGGFEARGNELDEVQLYEAWIKLVNLFGVDDLTLKIGRQEIVYGSGLIMGSNDFFTGTVHDGLVVDIPLGGGSTAHLFYAKEGAPDGLVNPGLATGGLLAGRFRASGDEDEILGIYTEIRNESLDPVEIDAYWVYFGAHEPNSNVSPINGTTSADPGIDSFGRAKIGGEFHTLGILLKSWDLLVDGLYLSAEFAYQIGDDETGADINAMVFEFTTEYALPFMEESRGRVFASYYFAEGPDGDSTQGFTPLFITRHKNSTSPGRGFSRLGNIDFIPTQNVHVVQIGFKFEPAERWTAGVTYLTAFLNHSSESVTVVQTGQVFVDDRHLGHEIDFFAEYLHNSQTQFFFNVSVFIPEFDYIFENPTSAATPFREVDSDLAFGAYAQVRVRF